MEATGAAAGKVELAKLNPATTLLHRTRYFSDGAVTGS